MPFACMVGIMIPTGAECATLDVVPSVEAPSQASPGLWRSDPVQSSSPHARSLIAVGAVLGESHGAGVFDTQQGTGSRRQGERKR